MKKFYSVLTEAGVNAFSAAAVTGVPVGFAAMAVGDGNGQQIQPDSSMTGLVHEQHRGVLNSLVIVDPEKNIIRAEMIIPPQTGGFWIREAALFNDDGVCLAVANVADAYKPLLAEGSGRNQSVRIWIAVSDTASVELKSDNAAILASQEDLLRVKNDTKDYTDKQVSDLEEIVIRNKKTADDAAETLADNINGLKKHVDEQSETLDTTLREVIAQAVSNAIREAWEDDNPTGTVRFFNAKVNPNTLWPWSTWVYTGENKSIRVGKADGSNVGQTSGSDTATIRRENLPAEKISVSGKAESAELNNVETTEAGGAEFNVYRFGADGRENTKGRFSLDDVEMGDVPALVKVESHKHKISLTVPSRAVSGETAALGEGKTLSIVEAHTLLMCWARTA